MPLIVDSNVLLDISERDPVWLSWSLRTLERTRVTERLAINAIVYAEISLSFRSTATTDAFLEGIGIELLELPREALFVAARAHQVYRRRGGPRTGVLPDFFIGAHAAVMDWPLLTRDPARYRAYFPTVELIAPT